MPALIAYYSRADENYFGGTLRYIDKGNTQIAAEILQSLTGADMFRIEQLTPYSKDYNSCIEEARSDLKGKTIKPFCTNEGSGMGKSEKDIKALCPDSNIEKGLSIWGSNMQTSQAELEQWINEIKSFVNK